jgi:chromosome partitioning protein
MLSKTIATINFKGGVGKTTMTWCLAELIANYHAVMVFDLDAQMSLTQAIAGNEGSFRANKFSKWLETSSQQEKTIYHALKKYVDNSGYSFSSDYIYKTQRGYDFVPAVEDLYWLDLEASGADRRTIPGFMRSLLGKIGGFKKYDYALFDCPPAFTWLSYSVLSCCDLILIPVNPDFYTVGGVYKIFNALIKWIEPFPKIGLFMNKVKTTIDRKTKALKMTSETQSYWDEVKEICEGIAEEQNLGIRCFETPICDRVSIK